MCIKFLFQVFYFMQPETTINKLADDLLKAVYDKFIKPKQAEVEDDDENDGEDEPLLKEQG